MRRWGTNRPARPGKQWSGIRVSGRSRGGAPSVGLAARDQRRAKAQAPHPGRSQQIGHLLQQGLMWRSKGELWRAQESFSAVLRLQPEQPDALQFLGSIALQTGQIVGAINLFRRAVVGKKADPVLRLQFGVALLRTEAARGRRAPTSEVVETQARRSGNSGRARRLQGKVGKDARGRADLRIAPCHQPKQCGCSPRLRSPVGRSRQFRKGRRTLSQRHPSERQPGLGICRTCPVPEIHGRSAGVGGNQAAPRTSQAVAGRPGGALPRGSEDRQ